MPSSDPDPGDLLAFYEDGPCGFLTLAPDGTVLSQNRTFLRSTGHAAGDLVGRRRLQDLLSPGSRIMLGTNWDPALELRGRVREFPAELLRADGSRMPVLMNADLERDGAGAPAFVRVSVFDAGDRRRYERDLVAARDVERAARRGVERLQRVSTRLSVALTPADVAAAVLEELVGADGTVSGRIRTTGPDAETVLERGDERPGPLPGLAVALEAHGSVVGSLDLRFERPRVLGDGERDFLRTCAEQCAQALGRAQLYVEVERRSAQQAVLARIGAAALRAAPLDELLRSAVTAVRGTLQADHVAIAERGDGAVVAGAAATGEPVLALPIGPAERPFGDLVVHRAGRPVLSRAERAFVDAVAFVLWNAIDRRRTEAAIRWQARHDHVTGLQNRHALEEHLQERIAAGGAFALALVDVDDFKLVNDSLGHEVGDELLREVGSRLLVELDADLVARLGGDEFVVIGTDPAALPDAVLAALERPFAVGGAELRVRVSIGVAEGDGRSAATDLLRDADLAMYAAKERGRDQSVRFEAAMLERGRERLQVEAELRVALAQDQLRVFYQPIVCATNGRLISFEALVRWEHPERGLVPPDRFIPAAERSGLIVELGDVVLEQACRQLVRWRADGTVAGDVTVAVNVSGRQLLHQGFPDRVVAALERAGLADRPDLLQLEITETVLMEAGDSPDVLLRALAALGVGLHLDDFGTGASSLARLKRFPVDTLKIDRAFVSGVTGEGTEDDAIVAAVMGMARALGLTVVAEGVETAQQHAYLRELGCDHLQGYRFSPPRPAAAVPELLGRLRHGLRAAA